MNQSLAKNGYGEPRMATLPLAFLVDVDNTLLDNDRFGADLRAWLDREIGPGAAQRYWHVLDVLRRERNWVDYLGAVQRCWQDDGRDRRWLAAGRYLLEYPFADRLYPGALAALARLASLGSTWLLSDGDAVMQPRKLQRAGLWDAVDARVLIYLHKEDMLSDIERHCPALRYVMIDDKLRVLDAMKRQWGERLVTIFARQGHYANDPAQAVDRLPADLTVEHIGDLAAADPTLFAPRSFDGAAATRK